MGNMGGKKKKLVTWNLDLIIVKHSAIEISDRNCHLLNT